jgi:hypothetical protein
MLLSPNKVKLDINYCDATVKYYEFFWIYIFNALIAKNRTNITCITNTIIIP